MGKVGQECWVAPEKAKKKEQFNICVRYLLSAGTAGIGDGGRVERKGDRDTRF